jgi:shikimate dehydrogenase
VNISGKTRVCGVIGDPIEHSLSPAMHNAAFNALGLDYAFLAFRVASNEVANAIAGMRALGIVGLNVTMPHKAAVIKFLDQIDDNSKFLNAINTIHNKNGKLLGLNTDGFGALKALKENGANPKGKRVLLLGSGGAARAIAYTLVQETDELVVLNRTVSEAKELANLLKKIFNKEVHADSLTAPILEKQIRQADILINATAVGMKPKASQSMITPEWLKPKMTVMDIVYNPVETKLSIDAKSKGAQVISGVEMLIYQGAASFEIWTGKQAPVEVMRKAALEQLSKV